MATKDVIAGFRQALSDLVAPELRTIAAKLDAMYKRLDAMDRRFDRIDARLDDHDDVQALKAQMAQVLTLLVKQEQLSA